MSSDGNMTPSGVRTHDPALRDSGELLFLTGVRGTLVPPEAEDAIADRDKENARRLKRNAAKRIGNYDYSRFRGLVVLVEFNDRSFQRPDSRDFFDRMINSEDYDGYTTLGSNPEKVECTGSVRDYFRDNSGGLFNPVFDIYGPVKVNRSVYDVNKYINAREIGAEALQALDAEVDFSRYDTDNYQCPFMPTQQANQTILT